MSFLPVIERELRAAARRKGAFRARFYSVLGCLLVWLFLAFSSRHATPHALSRHLFIAFGILALAFCLLVGVFLTADCLSEEKREGTLGLLFLTRVRSGDVVFGKLFATSLHAFYGVLACLPILSLPLLMGGVTIGEFWRVLLVLVLAAFFSLSAGLLVSALSTEARQALMGTLLLLFTLSGVLPALWWLLRLLGLRPPSAADFLLRTSPVHAYRSALSGYFSRSFAHSEYWQTVLTMTVMTLLAIVLSHVLLALCWKLSNERLATPPKPAKTTPLRSAVLRDSNANMLDINPFFWLSFRTAKLGRYPLIVLLLILFTTLYIISLLVPPNAVREPFIACTFIAFALHFLVKCMLALEATRQLSNDRQSGALELLLVSPLSEQEIISGQLRALKVRFRPLCRLLVTVNLVLLSAPLLLHRHYEMGTSDRFIFVLFFASGLVLLQLDFSAMRRLGMVLALKTSRHHRAVLRTLAIIMGPGWVMLFLSIFLLSTANGSDKLVLGLFSLWTALCAICDIGIYNYANSQLRRGFRFLLQAPATNATRSGGVPDAPPPEFRMALQDTP